MPQPVALARLSAIALLAAAQAAHADLQTAIAPVANPTAAVSVSASLDFTINLGKFLFFRVCTGAYPTASNTIATVAVTLSPTIPVGAVVPADGANTAVAWSGAAPSFSAALTGQALAVEVRSNAGAVTVRASPTTALSSGASTIPFSQITVVSSDPTNVPAPLIPDTGTGSAVAIAGSSFSNLVTTRSATWTFGYSNSIGVAAGNYTGQVTFTASSP